MWIIALFAFMVAFSVPKMYWVGLTTGFGLIALSLLMSL